MKEFVGTIASVLLTLILAAGMVCLIVLIVTDIAKPTPLPPNAPTFGNHKLFTDEDGNVVHQFKVGNQDHYYVVAPSGSATVTNEVRVGKVMQPNDVPSCRCKPEAELKK